MIFAGLKIKTLKKKRPALNYSPTELLIIEHKTQRILQRVFGEVKTRNEQIDLKKQR